MERTILHNATILHADELRTEEGGIVMFNHANPVLPPDLIGYSGLPEADGAPSLEDPLADDALMDLEGNFLLPGYIDLDLRLDEKIGEEGEDPTEKDAENASVEESGKAALIAYRHAGNALNRGIMAFACADTEAARAVQSVTKDYVLWAPEMFLVKELPEKSGFMVLRGAPEPDTPEEAEYLRLAEEAKRAGLRPAVATGLSPEKKVNGLMPVLRAAELLEKAGFPALEAIAAITSNPAEILGVSDRIGGLHAGMEGNVVTVKGNPLTDVSALQDICMLARGGRLTWSHMRALDRIRFALVPPGCEE